MLSLVADYTLGLVIVLMHLVRISVRERHGALPR